MLDLLDLVVGTFLNSNKGKSGMVQNMVHGHLGKSNSYPVLQCLLRIVARNFGHALDRNHIKTDVMMTVYRKNITCAPSHIFSSFNPLKNRIFYFCVCYKQEGKINKIYISLYFNAGCHINR